MKHKFRIGDIVVARGFYTDYLGVHQQAVEEGSIGIVEGTGTAGGTCVVRTGEKRYIFYEDGFELLDHEVFELKAKPGDVVVSRNGYLGLVQLFYKGEGLYIISFVPNEMIITHLLPESFEVIGTL